MPIESASCQGRSIFWAASKGTIPATETDRGQRGQEFVYKGLAAVTQKEQGVVWPKSAAK